jgi:hypothetical protein
MIAPPHKVIERLTRVAPFGLGLWDLTLGRLVADEMTVTIFRLADSRTFETVSAIANRSGVFVPHDLFGGAVFDEKWHPASASPADRLLITIRDTLDRYLPFALHLDPPLERGFAVPFCLANLEPIASSAVSPPAPSPYVPLFASPSRSVPAGMTAVRAALQDALTGAKAAYAVLEVHVDGQLLARGVADERGEVAAVFAYPEVTALPPWSPPGAPPPRLRLVEQKWTIDVTVKYRRNLPRFPLEPVRREARDAVRREAPDLCDVLQQPVATILTSLPVPLEVQYGEELVLAEKPGSELLIRPV